MTCSDFSIGFNAISSAMAPIVASVASLSDAASSLMAHYIAWELQVLGLNPRDVARRSKLWTAAHNMVLNNSPELKRACRKVLAGYSTTRKREKAWRRLVRMVAANGGAS